MSEYIGNNFDDFLELEGISTEVESVDWKRVIVLQIEQLMEEQKLSKTTMARRMKTSRAAIDRLLDSNNSSVTLQTLEKAAIVLGKRLHIELI